MFSTSSSRSRFLLLKEAAVLAEVTEKKLRHELEEKTMTAERWESGHWLFSARAVVYRRAHRRVISDPSILGGEPVFEGTRIGVRHVGLLALRGTSLDKLTEDFPLLRDEDFEFARFFAKVGKGPGRPRKVLELRRGE